MTERTDNREKKVRGKRFLFQLCLGITILILMAGCSSIGGDTGGNSATVKGGMQLPPAWTPTPISIPGTGLDVGTWMPCDDAPPSQLEVGDTAVFEGTSFKLRLRGEPSLEGTLGSELSPGENIEVINGPACSDKLVWWEIKSFRSGVSGWAAEGNSYDTWLVRID
jgi:hypothetical protein